MSTELRLDPDRLKRARLGKAMTQHELAEAANVHPVTVCRIETGTQSATVGTIRRLAEALNVAPTDIANVVTETTKETEDNANNS